MKTMSGRQGRSEMKVDDDDHDESDLAVVRALRKRKLPMGPSSQTAVARQHTVGNSGG